MKKFLSIINQNIMTNPKGNSTVGVMIAVLLTAVIVGGGGYFIFDSKLQRLEQEAANSQDDCFSNYTITNIVNNVDRSISFQYPCGWDLRNPGADTIVASSPDEMATFQWPVPDIGLYGMELTDEFTVEINGNDYPVKKYEDNSQVLEIVDVPVPNEIGYSGFMLSYKDSSYRDELGAILESIEF